MSHSQFSTPAALEAPSNGDEPDYMRETFAIGGIQMHLSAVQSNLQNMKHRIDVMMAIYPWIDMVMLSELAPYGPLIHNAQEMPGPAEEYFCDIAAKYGIWLIPGSMFEKKDGKVYNTSPVINPQGEVIRRYRKMFPFKPYETDVDDGTEFCVFDVPHVGRFGLSICYDMWFPETTRTLAAMGAEVIIHPTLTNSIDREIELSIAKATAAINQCYLFDINGLSAGGNGRSIVCGPDGYVLHQASVGAELIPIEVDLHRVRRSRHSGIRGLGQPLKSFRDRSVDFSIYREKTLPYLDSLGTLEKQSRERLSDRYPSDDEGFMGKA